MNGFLVVFGLLCVWLAVTIPLAFIWLKWGVGAATGVLLVAASLVFFGPDPRLFTVDWHSTKALPFPVTGHLEVARSALFERRSTLGMVCGPEAAHLVLRTNLPLPSDEIGWFQMGEKIGLRGTDRAHIFVGDGIENQLELNSRLVGSGLVETVVTEGILDEQVSLLIKWVEPGEKLSFGVHETGTYMRAVADGSSIRAFASDCTAKPHQGDVGA